LRCCFIYSASIAGSGRSRLKQRTEEAAIPTVAVVFPQEGAPTQEIVCPAILRHQRRTDLCANQWLSQAWYFDIGAHVKEAVARGDQTPASTSSCQQAQAELDTAQANLNIAKITANPG